MTLIKPVSMNCIFLANGGMDKSQKGFSELQHILITIIIIRYLWGDIGDSSVAYIQHAHDDDVLKDHEFYMRHDALDPFIYIYQTKTENQFPKNTLPLNTYYAVY